MLNYIYPLKIEEIERALCGLKICSKYIKLSFFINNLSKKKINKVYKIKQLNQIKYFLLINDQ